MNKTLLIMAAGMGSRFGGLKQIEPFGPNGEFIIDYSVYDAIRNGFNKIVFIIKKENYNTFRETIGKRIEDKIEVKYVFQELDNLPVGFTVPEGRIKPWGTGHAILCAKDVINESFAVINSDDFYGNDAYKALSEFIDKNNDSHEFGLVGYDVINTLTENGSVKRGVCITENGYLTGINESSIEMKDGIIEATSLVDGKNFIVDKNAKVSMNMMAFNPLIFPYLESKFIEFLEQNKETNENNEFFIPSILEKGINEKFCKVSVINTNAKWAGVTYKEDKDDVVNFIKNLIENGEYPNKLW